MNPARWGMRAEKMRAGIIGSVGRTLILPPGLGMEN